MTSLIHKPTGYSWETLQRTWDRCQYLGWKSKILAITFGLLGFFFWWLKLQRSTDDTFIISVAIWCFAEQCRFWWAKRAYRRACQHFAQHSTW